MALYESKSADFDTVNPANLSEPFVNPTYGFIHVLPNNDTDYYSLGELQAGDTNTLYVGGAIDEILQVGVTSNTFSPQNEFAQGEQFYSTLGREAALYQTQESGNGPYLEVPYKVITNGPHHVTIQDIGGGSPSGFVDESEPYVITEDPSVAASLTQSYRNGSNDLPEDVSQSCTNDNQTGGPGNERFEPGCGDDTVRGGGGVDQVYGNQGSDSLYGDGGPDLVFGGQGSDAVYGNSGNDQVYGNKADDLVFGGANDDALFGGQGDDQLFGGTGSDTIFGNKGDDAMNGGAGADSFFVDGAGMDRITDFDAGAGDQFGSFFGFDSYNLSDDPTGLEVTWQAGSESGTVIIEGESAASFDSSWLL